jgi:hypothetical protein
MDSDPKAAPRKSGRCRNCGAEALDAYCPKCGQETHEHLPTAREFVHEYVLHYLAAEGPLWRTLGALVLHPGRLTVEYVRGRKRRYVLPLRMYLTTSVVFFLVFKLASAPAAEHVSAAFQRSLQNGHTTFTIVDLGFAKAIRNPDGTFACTLPHWLCERIDERMIQPPGELQRRLSALTSGLFGHLSTAMFVLLPLFALYLQLAYYQRTYGEHFLFALHVHSFWFLVLLVLLIPWPGWLQLLLTAYMAVYGIAALHVVYASSWVKSLFKGLAIGAAYSVSLVVATYIMAIWAFVE